MIKLSLFLGLLMAVNTPSPTTMAAPKHDLGAMVTTMTSDEQRFLDLTNEERVSRGLQPLVIDPMLIDVARAHSQEMAEKRYFSHHSPTIGMETPMDRYLTALKHRPSWALVGENLFYCSIVDVDRGHAALMNSPTHRDNILEGRFDHMGVGIYVDQYGEFYVTEMFLSKTD